ncbi:MAG: sugar phosphate isomerase/epimerase [Ruminococcaceae bacterium]|nr:sugar phosphate isomerase/epimerase [Oscillospiraceae bacterium]
MKLGVLVGLKEDMREDFSRLNEMGIFTCQLCGWNTALYTDEVAQNVVSAAKEYGIEITAFWCGWSGPMAWNFVDGPATLGLVPAAYRYARMDELKQGSDFTKKIGVTDMITHVGFLPENPSTSEYGEVVAAIRYVAEYCRANGQYFLFETGQETPVTLLRTIERVGTGNLGINLDPANLILYGKGNPVDALDVFGKYVRNIHGKDGCYPTDGEHLGEETPLGEGKVNYPAFIAKLKEIGYQGPITIEREISGDQQIADIKAAKKMLEELIG